MNKCAYCGKEEKEENLEHGFCNDCYGKGVHYCEDCGKPILESKYSLEIGGLICSECQLQKEQLKFNYQILDRLQSDCKYYLGNGNRCTKHLYYKDEQEHIEEMKKLYNSFPADKKPEWLTFEQILIYEKAMID